MKYIDAKVGALMRRRGFRGRWITVYWHDYDGVADWTTMHSHPWKLAVSFLFRGTFIEEYFARRWTEGELKNIINGGLGRCYQVVEQRKAPSLRFYPASYWHRVKQGTGKSLFIGFFRTQRPMAHAETKCKEGWCHYTEQDGHGYT